MSLVTNFIAFPEVKEIWKLIRFVTLTADNARDFFETQCSSIFLSFRDIGVQHTGQTESLVVYLSLLARVCLDLWLTANISHVLSVRLYRQSLISSLLCVDWLQAMLYWVAELLGFIWYIKCRRTHVISDPVAWASVTWACCAKAAEWIEVLLGVNAFGDSGNIVLDGGPPSNALCPVVNFGWKYDVTRCRYG